MYCGFQRDQSLRILAYAIDGAPYGNYAYDDIQRPDDLIIQAIYLGLEDDIPKVLVFAHPDK